eukprot:scaffold272555_cov34-Prasinocladus_malaysianus.AAC.1
MGAHRHALVNACVPSLTDVFLYSAQRCSLEKKISASLSLVLCGYILIDMHNGHDVTASANRISLGRACICHQKWMSAPYIA